MFLAYSPKRLNPGNKNLPARAYVDSQMEVSWRLKFYPWLEQGQDMMKLAAISDAINAFNARAVRQQIQHVLVHIRQNSDSNSSDWYFNDIDFPETRPLFGNWFGLALAQHP